MISKSTTVVPVEVVTVTVQRSQHYIATDNPNAAIHAVEQHIKHHPELYDDNDDVIAYTHEVHTAPDMPMVMTLNDTDSVTTLEDLAG